VTLTPAEVFGVADRYGSLDAGKVANVVVWSGDPFDFSTGVEHVYIRGSRDSAQEQADGVAREIQDTSTEVLGAA